MSKQLKLLKDIIEREEVNEAFVEAWNTDNYSSYEEAKANGAVYPASNASHGKSALSDRIEGYADAAWALGQDALVLRVQVDGDIYEGFAAHLNHASSLSLARNPNLSAGLLEELSEDKDSDVREAVARNPNAPVEALTELAQDEDWRVRRGVAETPSTPTDLLSELARDAHGNVLFAVAGNPNTPVEALTELAQDKDGDVRWRVAENPSTPAEVLAELAQDEAEAVRKAAEWNRKTRKAAGNSKSYEVEIEGRVRKTYTVDAVSEEAAIEQAHEIFSVSNEEGVDEEYHQETVRVNEVQEDEGIKI
jgi:hypothetical protein